MNIKIVVSEVQVTQKADPKKRVAYDAMLDAGLTPDPTLAASVIDQVFVSPIGSAVVPIAEGQSSGSCDIPFVKKTLRVSVVTDTPAFIADQVRRDTALVHEGLRRRLKEVIDLARAHCTEKDSPLDQIARLLERHHDELWDRSPWAGGLSRVQDHQ